MLSKPTHDIGNTSTTTSNNNKCNYKERNDSTSKLFNKLITAFSLNEFKPFALRSAKSNTNLRSNSLTNTKKAQLSRSIGNITESHYDTVFNTDSYVIARGVNNVNNNNNNNNNNEDNNFNREYANVRMREDSETTVGLVKHN